MTRVQIRPAIYGAELLYEAYIVNYKSFWWWNPLKPTVSYELIYWKGSNYFKRVSEFSYNYKNSGEVRRTFDSLKQAEDVLNCIFGTDLKLGVWRPE